MSRKISMARLVLAEAGGRKGLRFSTLMRGICF
jgi:hypothetical protein